MKKMLLIIILGILMGIYVNSRDYVSLPSTSIRMRVIAASNSDADQKIKYEVKSIFENIVYRLIKKAKNSEDVDNLIIENNEKIKLLMKEEMGQKGIFDDFTLNYGYNYFPQKEFKGVVYPSGEYKSYVVTIGEGKGENWWCVMYPPLCLIDENNEEYEYQSLINTILEKYN